MLGCNLLTLSCLLTVACLSVLPSLITANHRQTSITIQRNSTPVNFTDAQVQRHLSALVKSAQTCVIRTRAQPPDVRAYFTNSRPNTKAGECFTACMLQQSRIIDHGKINYDLLVYLASLVNGKNSRVVGKLGAVSRGCLSSTKGIKDKCTFATTYNNCLNENMKEFSFPEDLAEEIIQKMPFHIVKANLPSKWQMKIVSSGNMNVKY